MPAPTPTIYLIAGCNGAGKTTFAKEFLPKEVKCLRFLNADEMARGLSPLDPAAGAAKAARLLLSEVRAAVQARQTFGLETTLSGLTYVRMLNKAREHAYAIKLFYLWLPSAVVAIRRVRERVRKGGHSVPAADIRRATRAASATSCATTSRWPMNGRFSTMRDRIPEWWRMARVAAPE